MWSQIWIFMVIVCGYFHLICSTVESSSEADKIQSLPGQPEVSFQQFGGYIPVDDKHQRALFYYFVEAETNPASKPLILWLNGDKSFFKTLNDDITARDNMVFLQRWLAKFPQYRNNEFYIMGESYAGHYVPQLAELIVKSKVNINLKGIALGNPLLEYETDFNSVDEFYWSHGMISDYVYELRSSVCNNSKSSRQSLRGCFSPECISVLIQIDDEYSELDYIDLYYVIGDKCLSYNLSQAAILTHWRRSSISQISRTLNMQKDEKTHQYHQELDNCPLKNAEMYLNRKEVQKALHAQLVGVNNYHLCSPREDEEIPTINIVGWLIKSGLKVIVYSGDQDSVVPFIGTRRLVDKLAKRLGLKTTVPYSAWFVGKQVGGWTQVYGDHDLTYATIRGASHSTPTTQPKKSFVLFDSFLRGKRLPKA
ncbi:Serine carboxypeptidase, serine active site [Sesbania bispinosa]|nr:Serine carboxypeptidase, serine active site [Sesbania bispinosa]